MDLNQKLKNIQKSDLLRSCQPQVEADPFCRKVLQARMDEGSLPSCPLVCDVVGYKPTGPACGAEAVTAGFPCQACLLIHFKLSSVRFTKISGFFELNTSAVPGIIPSRSSIGTGRLPLTIGARNIPNFRPITARVRNFLGC